MNSKTAAVAAAFLLTGAASFYSGYLVAESKLNKLYNEQMEAEIAKTKKFYQATNKPSLQEVAEAAGLPPLAEAAERVRVFRGDEVLIVKDGVLIPAEPSDLEGMEDEEDEKLEAALVAQNVWQEEQQIVTEGRTADIPYQITIAEFTENVPEYDQVDVTWYAGDDVLTDENDGLVDDHKCVGDHNLQLFGTGHDPNVVLVRNERLRVDYSIVRHMGKFAHVVQGFAHSDEPYERTRRTRRDADE